MTTLIRVLMLLGIVEQAWLLYAFRYDLRAIISLGELAMCFLPIALAAAGAGLATWLRRRGSGWAWPVAGVPTGILAIGLGLAVFLTLNPITLHQR